MNNEPSQSLTSCKQILSMHACQWIIDHHHGLDSYVLGRWMSNVGSSMEGLSLSIASWTITKGLGSCCHQNLLRWRSSCQLPRLLQHVYSVPFLQIMPLYWTKIIPNFWIANLLLPLFQQQNAATEPWTFPELLEMSLNSLISTTRFFDPWHCHLRKHVPSWSFMVDLRFRPTICAHWWMSSPIGPLSFTINWDVVRAMNRTMFRRKYW